VFGWQGRLQGWLSPVTGTHEHAEPVIPGLVITVTTLVLVFAASGVAWQRYARAAVPTTPPPGNPLTVAARQDLYQDKVNDGLLVIPGTYTARALVFMDGTVVDGTVMGVAHGTVALGDTVRRPQTGYVRHYAAAVLLGLVTLVVIVLAVQS